MTLLLAALSLCPTVGVRSDCVVDGDTLWHGRTKVRIEAIDTPEIGEAKCASELALGIRARDRLLVLLNSGRAEIAYSGRQDRYKRPLVRVAVNGRDVGGQLIREGLARRYVKGRLPWCPIPSAT